MLSYYGQVYALISWSQPTVKQLVLPTHIFLIRYSSVDQKRTNSRIIQTDIATQNNLFIPNKKQPQNENYSNS